MKKKLKKLGGIAFMITTMLSALCFKQAAVCLLECSKGLQQLSL